MLVKGLLIFCALLLASPDSIEYSILSEGTTGGFSSSQNVAIKSQDELKRLWSDLGIKSEIPSVDFSKELVVVIVTGGKLASSTEISGAERKSDDLVEVRYVARPFTSAGLSTRKEGVFPYVVSKLYPLDLENVKVRFIEDIPLPPLPKDSSIGQIPPYTNVLKAYEDTNITHFLPLDKGNLWTYRIESQDESGEETYSILSISQDGWSVFDRFFGQEDIAMRVDPSGDIFVSSEKGMQGFYTDEVDMDFNKSEFTTPAGKFNDLMVVTVPDDGQFWFKDVYARGVGLIYHERKTPKGTVKYSLIKAKIRGTDYPPANN